MTVNGSSRHNNCYRLFLFSEKIVEKKNMFLLGIGKNNVKSIENQSKTVRFRGMSTVRRRTYLYLY